MKKRLMFIFGLMLLMASQASLNLLVLNKIQNSPLTLLVTLLYGLFYVGYLQVWVKYLSKKKSSTTIAVSGGSTITKGDIIEIDGGKNLYLVTEVNSPTSITVEELRV